MVRLLLLLLVIEEANAIYPAYRKQKAALVALNPRASLNIISFVGIAAYHIWVNTAVPIIFGGQLLLEIFFPTRFESPAVRMAWKFWSIFECCETIGDGIGLVVCSQSMMECDCLGRKILQDIFS